MGMHAHFVYIERPRNRMKEIRVTCIINEVTPPRFLRKEGETSELLPFFINEIMRANERIALVRIAFGFCEEILRTSSPSLEKKKERKKRY